MGKDQPRLFDKYPGESAKRYAAFCKYRNMPPEERTLIKVAQELATTKTPANIRSKLTQLKHWSSQDKWVSRCEAWDAEQERIYRKGLEEKQKEMQKRQANIALVVVGKAVERLKQVNPSVSPDDMTVAEAIRLLEIGTRMERHALGEPDQIVKHTEVVHGLSEELLKDPAAVELLSKLSARVKSGRVKVSTSEHKNPS